MPNPAYPPKTSSSWPQRQTSQRRPSHAASLPMRIEAGVFRGYRETVHLRPAPMDPAHSLLLVTDQLQGQTAIRLIEPNVRELRDMLNKWLGED